MATVFVPPSPRNSMNMATRRPLANVPNATNSPHRTGILPGKRSRSTQMEIPYGQPPPKKQVMESIEYESRTATCRTTNTDSKLFTRRSNNARPSAFERRLVAAREKDRQVAAAKQAKAEKNNEHTMESIRQWQRHYRKAFPQFVFYFDSLPEDLRRRCSRQVMALGAREEKFFSLLVTHVVTSRTIPPESTEPVESEATAAANNGDASLQTVNPSLLQRNGESHLHVSLKTDVRRDQGTMDILQRARKMGMKIWALEKLQRMITTINDPEIASLEAGSRSKAAGGHATQGKGENDLSRLLRQELVNGPSDRDPFASMEMIMFKGPFIYIHDMNEKSKPVMVREYPRVAKRQDGTWPQFRSAPLGKCPFIDEPPSRKEVDRQKLQQMQKEKIAARTANENHNTEPKAVAPVQEATEDPTTTEAVDYKPSMTQEQHAIAPVQPAMEKPSFDEAGERKSSESFIAPRIPRAGPFYAEREPAASGIQPSNVTSAIRSQMVSSTAAVPGAKAGLSKEVHGLQRKVLEKGTGGFVTGSMAAPHRHAGGSTAIPMKNNLNPPGKSNLGHNGEQAKQSELAGSKRQRDDKEQPKKPARRKDANPGYCENCRDKFDDFEEHIMARKHRRFATNPANWAELDSLLFEIQRPLKDDYELL
ncbi:Regulatory subunit Dfp1/Him1 central region [Penicillium sp. DV-2018c]|nr:Regulatory subunit Dfp1/Him1 central region [Penicillium sp. DV-2018c]KAJ5583446.1 Regulatory subunit Dfp1/Him1 central region [Penicillium sp. DV-2018c]